MSAGNCSRQVRRAEIWTGGNTRVVFMVDLALRTLAGGLNASGFTVNMGRSANGKMADSLRQLGTRDIFIWVGVADFTLGTHYIKRLAALKVMTVFYDTDSHLYWDRNCTELSNVHAQEIWTYTHSNLAVCPSARVGKTVRYIPPGYMSRTQMAPKEEDAATMRMLFFGSSSRSYDKRRACLSMIYQGLSAEVAIASTDYSPPPPPPRPQALGRAPKLCTSVTAANLISPDKCPLQIVNSAHSDSIWDAHIAFAPYFLNLHKGCESTATASIHACESFRFSMLLASGARVYSEHCHPLDEAEFAGLVQFRPVKQIASAAVASWTHARRNGSAFTPRERAAAFAERFSPRMLFDRAGLSSFFAQRRECQLPNGSDPRRRGPAMRLS